MNIIHDNGTKTTTTTKKASWITKLDNNNNIMKITENIFDDKNFEFKIPETLPTNVIDVDDFIDEGIEQSSSSSTSTLNIEQLSSNDQSSGYYLRSKCCSNNCCKAGILLSDHHRQHRKNQK